MGKKKQSNRKTYRITIYKYGFSNDISIEQTDHSKNAYTKRISIDIKGVNEQNNKKRLIELFGVLNNVVNFVCEEEYPRHFHDALNYTDEMIERFDSDIAEGVISGDDVCIYMPQIDLNVEWPADEDARKQAHEGSRKYKYDIYGIRGERAMEYPKKEKK